LNREGLRSFDKNLSSQITALQKRLASVEVQAPAIETAGNMSAQISALQKQFGMLEQIITEHPAWSRGYSAALREGLQSPVVSIIMPVRNRARHIAEAVESVRAQRFTDWELIIVDDGSTDNVEAMLAPYAGDNRIRYERRTAQGAPHARNHGLSLARGAFIAYLDSDNLFFPDFLGSAVASLMDEQATDLVYGALVTEHHGLNGTQVLWRPFDRSELEKGNFIDLNVIVHRRGLFETFGGFDQSLPRLQDWDLLLRYTEAMPAKPLPVLAARYRVLDEGRISGRQPAGPTYLEIRRKWQKRPGATRRPRVLYVLWHWPQLSETYVETELRYMLRMGVHVEVWAEIITGKPSPMDIPIHSGSLAEAVAKARPDVVHGHWLHYAIQQRDVLEPLRVPVTARVHGFEFTNEVLEQALGWKAMRAIYAFPHHVAASPRPDPRLRMIPSAFDTQLFKPNPDKDRRLVLRTAPGLPSKDIPLFFALAKELPEHRFVLTVVTCQNRESYIEEIKQEWRRSGTPAELMIDLPRSEVTALVEKAGIYVHTARAPGEQDATPPGNPISIVEAMATGAYVLVRNIRSHVEYVGEAGTSYRDLREAAAKISATTAWTERQWHEAWLRSVDRAFVFHADELALRPILDDWMKIVSERGDANAPTAVPGGVREEFAAAAQ
jgi:glycosyltransferase involved in cell wall biosynthesis